MRVRLLGVLSLCAAGLVLTPQTAVATDPNLSLNLGTVLGSEEFCGLEYDQDAIQSFIEKHVSANDVDFASDLSTMTAA
jgi:hypothetical protein